MCCDVISRVTFRLHCVILFYGVILSTNSSNDLWYKSITMSSSVIICVLCLEAIVEVTNMCDRGHALCYGCTTIFEGCPACNDYTMKPFSKSTVPQGDTKQTAIEVIDSDDDDDQNVAVGSKRKTPSDDDDDVCCVKCNEKLEEDDDFTIFECSKRHFACGACIQLLDECPVCDIPRPKRTKLCECVNCVAEGLICDAEPEGYSCIGCSSIRVKCVFEN